MFIKVEQLNFKAINGQSFRLFISRQKKKNAEQDITFSVRRPLLDGGRETVQI